MQIQGIKADPEKTRAINEIEPPADREALHRFVGMTNYIRLKVHPKLQ